MSTNLKYGNYIDLDFYIINNFGDQLAHQGP